MSRSRGRPSSTVTTSTMRPGRGDITTTRSPRKAASGIECVMKATVLPDSRQAVYQRRMSSLLAGRGEGLTAPGSRLKSN